MRTCWLPSDGGINYLTVLLSEDGIIQRESFDFRRLEDLKQVRSDDPNDVTSFAESIARRLGIEVDQIGLMGSTTLEEGSMSLVVDASGNPVPNDKRRVLAVQYAWVRRAGEAAPTLGQGGGAGGVKSPGVDVVAALAIVERVIPDAFKNTDRSLGEPTVVLSVEGKVIGAGRVRGQNSEERSRQMQQLAPGVMLGSYNSVRLVNSAGARVDVQFAWEAPPAIREMRERAGQAATGR